MLSEQEILQQLKSGNATAFKAIYDLYVKRIFRFAHSLLRNKIAAEEITQEVFVKLWENRAKIDTEKGFSAWLYIITRNAIYNLTRTKFYGKLLNTSLEELQHQLIAEEKVVESADLIKFLYQLIGKLPAQRKKVFLMSRDSELSYKEIAELLNISENTVKTHVRLALKFFREELEKEGISYSVVLFLYYVILETFQ